jgi:hypothetical protein
MGAPSPTGPSTSPSTGNANGGLSRAVTMVSQAKDGERLTSISDWNCIDIRGRSINRL